MSPARHDGIVVLISGRGSNLQALIDAAARDELGAPLSSVISNEPDAAGLDRAREAGIATTVVSHREHRPRAAFDDALADAVEAYAPRLVVLAGFMRVLGPGFVNRFAGRCINIHPSLLPLYPGLNTHQRALGSGDTEHGASVHFVTEALDGGPLIAQVRVPIEPGDVPATLAARVLEGEHALLPTVVRWFFSGKLTMEKKCVVVDGQAITTPRLVSVR